MIIYLVTFGFSCLFFKLAEISKKKFEYYTFTFLALLIPCLLAGFRHETIGTDITVYVKPLFEAAQRADSFSGFLKESWFYVWTNRYVYEYEIGFNILVFLVAKLTNNFQFLLFLIQCAISVPIYIGIKNIRASEKRLWLCMLVYYLMLYHSGYNLMRQFMAMAIVFLGVTYLLKNNIKKYWICIIIGMLFHTSSIIGILYFFIYKFLYSSKKIVFSNQFLFKGKFRIIFLLIVGIMLILNLDLVIAILDGLNLSKFTAYIKGDLSFSILTIVVRLPIIILFWGCRKKIMNKEKETIFFVAVYIIDLLVAQFASINVYAGQRIGSYFSIFNILSFPLLCECWKSKSWKGLYKFLLIGYMLFYWYYYFVYSNANETVPYLLFTIG